MVVVSRDSDQLISGKSSFYVERGRGAGRVEAACNILGFLLSSQKVQKNFGSKHAGRVKAA